MSLKFDSNLLGGRATGVETQLRILDVGAVGAGFSGDCPAQEHDCILGVGEECVVGNELCPLLAGIVADSPFHWVQGWVY